MKTYSSYTYNSPNFIKKFLHQRRYRNILKNLNIGSHTKILDFGCGDGRLFRVLIDEYGVDPKNLIAFDPIPAMISEFKNLVPEVDIYADCKEIKVPLDGDGFDYIFCCEVFEHLTPDATNFAIEQFSRLATKNTNFIIEVPIEIGPVGFLKNIYRRFISGVDIPFKVILKAFFCLEQVRKPRVTSEGGITFEHPGYSFKSTQKTISSIMVIVQIFNDPFRGWHYFFNNSRIFMGRIK